MDFGKLPSGRYYGEYTNKDTEIDYTVLIVTTSSGRVRTSVNGAFVNPHALNNFKTIEEVVDYLKVVPLTLTDPNLFAPQWFKDEKNRDKLYHKGTTWLIGETALGKLYVWKNAKFITNKYHKLSVDEIK